MNHFDEMTALLYWEAELDAERMKGIRSHSAVCSDCRHLLDAMHDEEIWLREQLAAGDEMIPARVIEAPSSNTGPWWGWITALALGAAGAYTFWSGIVAPWMTQADQAGFTQGNLLTMLFFTGAFWEGWNAMLSLTELTATVTLGVTIIWLLRRHWHKVASVTAMLGAILLMLGLAPTTRAADIRHGDPNYVLPAGAEIHTDLIVAGNTTRIDGTVDGDLIAFSQIVTVNGHVKGDIISFTRELRVDGIVDGNVRTFSHTAALDGAVAKNVTAWAGQMDLDEKGTIGGTLTVGSGDAILDGKVAGDLLALADSIEINGSLGRDALIRAQRLTIGSTATITGHTKFEGWRQPTVSSSAQMGSPIEAVIRRRGPDYASTAFYRRRLLFWGASLLFGIALLLIAPGFYFDTKAATKKVGMAMGWGFLFFIALPIAAALAGATIVGLGVSISAILSYAIAIYASQLFVGAWLGEKIIGSSVGVGAAIGRLALGLAILHVLRILPFVGPLITILAVLWGLGAIILTLYKRMRPNFQPSV